MNRASKKIIPFLNQIRLSIFFCVVAILSAPILVEGAEDEIGAFGFINAVDSEVPTFLSVNGEVYKRSGYRAGQVTTAGRLYVGPTTFRIENEELGSASLTAPITVGEPLIIVAYVERVEKEDGEVELTLKVTRIASRPTSRTSFSGLIASNRVEPVTLLVNSTPVLLEPRRLIELSSKGSITVAVPGTQDGEWSAAPESSAHFIVVGYEKKDGSIATLLYEDNPSIE